MIDEPESSVPHQHVRVARRPIDVGHVGVEPHDRRGEVRVRLFGNRVEGHGARKVVEREVETGTRPDQVLDLRVRLSAGEFGVQRHEDDLRHWQPCRTGDLPGYQLSDERLGSLPRTAEFEHVHAIIIRFDNGWKRSPFAQRGNIPCGNDCSQVHGLSTALPAWGA